MRITAILSKCVLVSGMYSHFASAEEEIIVYGYQYTTSSAGNIYSVAANMNPHNYYQDYNHSQMYGTRNRTRPAENQENQEDQEKSCTRPGSKVARGSVVAQISFTEAYGGANGLSDNAWHEIAEEAQETFGNNITYSGVFGFVLTVQTFVRVPSRGFGFTIPGITLSAVPIYGNPNLSLYENIMSEMNRTPREDALEEYACE
ncbi:hypothetical protein R50076_02630 [Gilvimarinus japonicus]